MLHCRESESGMDRFAPIDGGKVHLLAQFVSIGGFSGIFARRLRQIALTEWGKGAQFRPA
jgi:hypothetical protein